MREGSVFFVYYPPANGHEGWPPDQDGTLFKASRDDVNVLVRGHTDGSFSVTVEDTEGNRFGGFRSQVIRFANDGAVTFGATWSEAEVFLYVNGERVEAAECANERVVEGLIEEVEPGPLSFDHPDVNQACAEWMQWRTRFANPAPARATRRTKAPQELVNEFRDALRSLGTALESVKAGQVAPIAVIAGLVRSLLYWQDLPRSQYNPLLLRLAGRNRLALPIYAFRERAMPQGVPEPDSQFHGGMPAVVAISPDQELMDVQEWLCGAAITRKGIADKETVKETISLLANTGGAAHFDEDSPELVDEFRSVQGARLDQLQELVLDAGRITYALGIYVSERLEEAGYGN